MSSLPKIITVVGPTASGKTDLAVSLAKRFNGEIVLADSRQVYRGMDIGTNKTRGKKNDALGIMEVDGIPYRGVDLVDPDELFTVQDWKKFALTTINAILSRNHLPIIEGGTGLYVSTLLDNWDIPEVPPNTTLRAELEQRIQKEGVETVAQEVLENDPDASTFLDIKNPRRVIRALEVMHATQLPFSQQRQRGPKLFDDLRIGILRPIDKIDQKIAERAQTQFVSGLEQEVRGLTEKYGWDIPPMSGVGYSEWKDYFAGQIERDAVLQKNIQRNQQLARAQLKWFRRNPTIQWIKSAEEAEKIVEGFLSTK